MLANGTTLGYDKAGTGSSYTKLKSLKKVPDLGFEPEMVENSTIDAKNKQYDVGVGDAGDLEYTFKYSKNDKSSETRAILELCDAGKEVGWEHTYPDGTAFHFKGIPSYKIVGGELNSPLELVVKIGISSDLKRKDKDAL